jgi:hypothetical protein
MADEKDCAVSRLAPAKNKAKQMRQADDLFIIVL